MHEDDPDKVIRHFRAEDWNYVIECSNECLGKHAIQYCFFNVHIRKSSLSGLFVSQVAEMLAMFMTRHKFAEPKQPCQRCGHNIVYRNKGLH